MQPLLQVCKSLTLMAGCAHELEAKMRDLNLIEYLWRPLGGQFIGSLISHLRKYKVNSDGSFVIMKDMEMYTKAIALVSCPETVDMMSSLKDIVFVVAVSAGKVATYVHEDLQHLDLKVVLSLVRMRADFNTRSIDSTGHWARDLASLYPLLREEIVLPWESFNSSSSHHRVWPSTLRGQNFPLKHTRRQQIARNILGISQGAWRVRGRSELLNSLSSIPLDDAEGSVMEDPLFVSEGRSECCPSCRMIYYLIMYEN